jgi:hypothetical protein
LHSSEHPVESYGGSPISRRHRRAPRFGAEADRALYLAKASGRNRVVLASEMAPQMHGRVPTGREGPKPEPPLAARQRGAGSAPR